MCGHCRVWAYRRRGPPCFGGLDRLTVNDPSTGLPVFARGHPDIAALPVVHDLPRMILAPDPTVVVYPLPGGKVMGQQAPRTATTQDIQESIEHFGLGVVLRSPSVLGLGHIRLDQLPLLVAQVGRVRLTGFHAPSLTHMPGPGQSF